MRHSRMADLSLFLEFGANSVVAYYRGHVVEVRVGVEVSVRVKVWVETKKSTK